MSLEKINAVLRLDGPPCRFGSPGEMRRELTDLVIAGTKKATAGLLAEYEAEGETVPAAGMRSAVIDDDEQVVGVMVTARADLVRLADVSWEFADAEGEGFTDVAHWRSGHERFWRRHSLPLLRQLLDPDFTLDDDTVVVCEWFAFEPLDPRQPWLGPPEVLAT